MASLAEDTEITLIQFAPQRGAIYDDAQNGANQRRTKIHCTNVSAARTTVKTSGTHAGVYGHTLRILQGGPERTISKTAHPVCRSSTSCASNRPPQERRPTAVESAVRSTRIVLNHRPSDRCHSREDGGSTTHASDFKQHDGIRLYGAVHREDGQVMLECLCHQDAIERVAVQRRQPGEMCHRRLLDGEAAD